MTTDVPDRTHGVRDNVQKAAATMLEALLQSLDPVLNEGIFVFAATEPGFDQSSVEAIATFRESEGLTIIVEETQAQRAGLRAEFRAAWITLRVHSELAAVGLTAAVSAALAQAGIPCNVLAALHHDHLFVPIEQAPAALDVLRELQRVSLAQAPVTD
jgi:hypothetical protein